MNSVVDIALADRLTLPIGLISTFDAQTDETIIGRDGNMSLGRSHDSSAVESVVVRQTAEIHQNTAHGIPIAR